MVSGEMGLSLWAHPKSYTQLILKYRGALAAQSGKQFIKMGVALHWNKVCGDCFKLPDGCSYNQYNDSYYPVSELFDFCTALMPWAGWQLPRVPCYSDSYLTLAMMNGPAYVCMMVVC